MGSFAPGVMLWRMSGPLNALQACGTVRVLEDDVIELLPNEQEAHDGGMITISMRVPVRRGHEVVDELFSAWLALPPHVADGAVLAPSALLPGMVHPPSFRVRVGSS